MTSLMNEDSSFKIKGTFLSSLSLSSKTNKEQSNVNNVCSSSSSADSKSADDYSSMLSTKECMKNLIDEIETLSKELVVQTINSNKLRVTDTTNNELLELTKIIIQKQNQLNVYIKIAFEQQILNNKINKIKAALVERDSDIKHLLLYLKEAEQVLSSAVYQSRLKLNMIKKAKPLPSELIIRYSHKISSDFGVCCPENWSVDNPRRPYPTDADMRKGWLAKINTTNDLALFSEDASNQNSDQTKSQLARSNSKMIDPIVPQEFAFSVKDGNSTDINTDSSSDTSSDSDSNMG